jgi:hypothetical protein
LVCPSVLVLLAIVLSVLLRFMESDYPFGIIELFLFVQFAPKLFIENKIHRIMFIK